VIQADKPTEEHELNIIICYEFESNVTLLKLKLILYEYSGSESYYLYIDKAFSASPCTPCGRAQLHRLSTVDGHTDVMKPIHGKII